LELTVVHNLFTEKVILIAVLLTNEQTICLINIQQHKTETSMHTKLWALKGGDRS